MKIKSQFRLLIFGIVIIPVVAFVFDAVYTWYMSRLILLFALPSIFLFSVFMSLFIVRSITRSIAVLEDATRRIASGELDLAVDVRGSNEITSLSNSLNKMRNTLKEEERRRYFFMMGITHDLKTPLALIKANVEAIEDGIAANPEEQKHSLHIINNKVDEMEGNINNLLELVSMNSAKDARDMRETNLRSFLSSYAERVTLDAELLHHKVESNINIPDSCTIRMDSGLIQRALDSIVNNSFRYTSNGSCLFIDAEPDKSEVKLIISDNGGGIHEKDLPYIFDLFYRGSASRREQGMGIGLAVTKAILDSHGWSISASPMGRAGTKTIPDSRGWSISASPMECGGTSFIIGIPLP